MAEQSRPLPERRRGRPRGGGGDARARILSAAAAEFSAHGYDSATTRAIAERAGVDASLIHHYFGTKSDLLAAAVGAPLNPARILPEILEGDLSDAGERIVRFIVGMWDDPAFGQRGVAVLRVALGGGATSALVTGFLSREILRRIGDRIGGADAERRATLVASQILGLIAFRYVLKIGDLAAASVDDLVRDVGPTIQRYLTGELGGDAPTPAG